jgi:hypothetical protein
MKASLLVAISIVPVVALADDPLPKRPDFNRYKAMLDPFAVRRCHGCGSDGHSRFRKGPFCGERGAFR